MTKLKLVNDVAGMTGKQRKDVEDIVETTMWVIKENMVNGRNIYLRGFGSFILKKRATKVGRNIAAGTPVVIPEHYTPAFKPAKSFVNRVKNNVK